LHDFCCENYQKQMEETIQMANENHFEFQAEIRQLLNILTHSLYTHREVFIRELTSNASDALDKVRFKSIKGEQVTDGDLAYRIDIQLDKKNKVITISDTGIGMTRDELIQNLGTIAKSGTSEFIKQMSAEKDVNLIGRFGIGFYSVFMAGERVEITTRSAVKEEPAWLWKSDGQGNYEIEPAAGEIKRGTSVKVFLREDAEEFADKARVQNIIEKYSNFVPFPIYLDNEQVNKITAIWREPKTSVKPEQYNEFFKFIARENEDALTWLHLSAEVPLAFHTLLFVPKANFELFGFGRDEEGIHLFVRRVLIDAHAKEILPNYLRFVRGVLESDDLPLNISRETLQENAFMIKMTNTVVSKFLSHLSEFAKSEPDKFKEFWKQHGRIFKEGYNDFTHKEKIAELFRFNSSKCADREELVSLQTYVDRMVPDQQEIYYLSGPDRTTLEASPAMEIFRAKDIEVLFCYDPIDEFALPGLMEFQKKKILSADQVDMAQLTKIPSKETEKTEPKADKRELSNLARRIKDVLGAKVEDVVISERLVASPAVLIGVNKGISSQMEKMMHLYREESPAIKRIMEINGSHPLILDLLKIYQKNAQDPLLGKIVDGLYQSVAILDGMMSHPNEAASSIQDVLTETARLYLNTTPAEPNESGSGESVK
jgi:molecular chaperone HtpG